MKIIDLDTFLCLPPGVLFSKYQPIVFGELSIKGESIPEAKDFFYQSIADAVASDDMRDQVDLLDVAERDGISIPMDFSCISRDGCFRDDQLFAVWELQDVQQFVSRLNTALEQGYGQK